MPQMLALAVKPFKETKMKYFCVLLLVVMPLSVMASVVEEGKIDDFIIEGDIISIWLSGENDLSECAGGARWTMQESDANYEAKISAILMVAASNKEIKFKSTGSCGNWASNKIYYIHMEI